MSIPYTVQRNGIFYFNYRLPFCGTVFKKSLRTDSARLCRQLVKNIIGEVKFRMQRNEKVTKTILSDVIETLLAHEVRHIAYHSDAVLKPTSSPHSDLKTIYNHIVDDIDSENEVNEARDVPLITVPTYEQWVVNRMTTHGYNPSRYDQIMLNNRDRILGANADDVREIVQELKKATELAIKLGEYILSNDFIQAKQQSQFIKERYNHLLPDDLKEPVATTSPPQESFSKAPTFNDVLAEWQKTWRLTERMERERTKFYKWFTHYLGDLPVNTITRKTLNSMFSQLCNFPLVKRGSPYYAMTVEQLIEVAEDDALTPEETQGANLRNGWKHLSPFFTYCLEQEYIEDSPKLTIRLEPNTRRGCFTLTQMNQLVRYYAKNNEWAALLQIYTGARNTEIQQLRKEDILTDEDTGILYIRISEDAGKVKTQSSNRRVPVAQALLDHGFKEWFDQQNDGRLFPTNLNLTLLYKEAKAALNLPDQDMDDLALTAYSVRHRMNTSLIEAGVHDLAIKAITGHSAGSSRGNMTAHYAHIKSLAALKAAIDRVVY